MRINEGTPEITTAFDQLDRPWTRHRAYDWRNGTFAEASMSPVSDNGE
jgi:hypothetical protein